MRSLDVEGLFWLDDDFDNKLYGHLTYEPQAGGRLELNGSLRGLQEYIPIQIQGKTERGVVTLVGCRRLSLSRWVSDISLTKEVYLVEFIFEGVHFVPTEEREFSASHIEFKNLDRWVWKPSATVQVDYQEDDNSDTQMVITARTPAREIVAMDGGDLELVFGCKHMSSHPMGETTISEYVGIGFRFSEHKPLRAILFLCRALQNLLTIGLHDPSVVEAISLEISTTDYSLQDLPPVQRPITFYAKLQGDWVSPEQKSIHPMEMLFTFDDIGGLDGVARWLRISDRFDIVIGLLLGHQYLPATYEENRLLNTLIAAEALIRIRTGKQKFSFKKGLIDMVNQVGDVFRSMVVDTNSWAKDVEDSRTFYLVHPGLHGRLNASKMNKLSGSLYFLVVMCLLREVGVPDATLLKIGDNRRFKELAEAFKDF